MDARLQRAQPEAGTPYAGGESEFRTDLERIRFAQSFSRLAEVTQVIPAGATGGVVHNRLTHSIKVTAVARAVAVRLLRISDPELLRELGGLDHVVVQAAANAHDLGHPPFGHLGERVLDQLLRDRFGLSDGFEGNAQTFRILTELEVHGPGDEGLNLTAASRAGVLKYPWGRFVVPDPHPSGWSEPPRGAGFGLTGPGSGKFSAYTLDLDEMLAALSAFPDLPPGRQTLECSMMDLADDIAYSLHDVEDFHRSGVLQFSPVSGEFRSWVAERRALAAMGDSELVLMGRWPGAGLEQLRRRLIDKDDWMFDEETFADAVDDHRRRVRRRRAGRPVRRVDDGRPSHLRLRLPLDRPLHHLGGAAARPAGAVGVRDPVARARGTRCRCSSSCTSTSSSTAPTWPCSSAVRPAPSKPW